MIYKDYEIIETFKGHYDVFNDAMELYDAFHEFCDQSVSVYHSDIIENLNIAPYKIIDGYQDAQSNGLLTGDLMRDLMLAEYYCYMQVLLNHEDHLKKHYNIKEVTK